MKRILRRDDWESTSARYEKTRRSDELNNEFKIATKNCTNKSLDDSLRVSELPHPSERFPLNLVNFRKNIEKNFPVVIFTDGSKINTKVGLAFVIFQDFIEIETRQSRTRDECSVFLAELLCTAQAVSWICNNEILSSNFLICSDSLSSLCALNNINSQNKLIVLKRILISIFFEAEEYKFSFPLFEDIRESMAMNVLTGLQKKRQN
ncbi:retrovirus-related Pol polyprotein from type-1 retrotransposable element R1 4 [Trichonephila clavipes]|nr:retrovirus-related Pol polyprotein from type-1 retrotransposable element R1 4 [Trichonephila clavipes]